ncbi:ASCH domain-containing protein [Nonomuraea sp. FMUSA5-5]|uniref:ASCH domain-containing protein n=1 Tax=Nonomuraea composti TaxID=2720023 RepID=A0ABX1BNY3_9ACTN|nr:ASCH domain-containing protein [Nonomuraea sp. FMUSA5-5]NJP97992.1 ASCH domain-containing protein [Nonomuraea sp. FMUSA5-5]
MSEAQDVPPRRELNLRKPYFDLIVSGVKTVEVRVGYASMRKIQPGQLLDFVAGEQRLRTRVVRVSEYVSFEELLKHEDPVAIGGELGEDTAALLAVIRSIYPPEKERLGVLAIEVEVIS